MKNYFTKQNMLPVVLSSALFSSFQVLAQQTANCIMGNAQAEVESGNIKTILTNGGEIFWDLQQARFEVPKGSGKHSISAGAIWSEELIRLPEIYILLFRITAREILQKAAIFRGRWIPMVKQVLLPALNSIL